MSEEVQAFLASVYELAENLPEDEEAYAAYVEQVKALYEALSEEAKADEAVQELFATLAAVTMSEESEFTADENGVYHLVAGNVRSGILWLSEQLESGTLSGPQTIDMDGASFSLGADNPIEIPSGLSLTLRNTYVSRKEGYKNPVFSVKDGAFLTIENGSVTDNAAAAAQTPLVATKGTGTFTLGEGASADIVAKNAGGYYSTLAAAVTAGDGETVVLLENVTECVTIESGKNVTLDLNGKTLTGKNGNTIDNNGILTILDKSENQTGMVVGVNFMKADGKLGKGTAITNETNAECTIDGGMFTREAYLASEHTVAQGNNHYTVHNKGVMTIAGGKVVNNADVNSLVGNFGTLNINGGEIEQVTYITVINKPGAVLNISGGTITGAPDYSPTSDTVIQGYGTVNIRGGTINGGSISTWAYDNDTTYRK